MKNQPINLSLNNRYQIERELSQKAGRKTFLAKDTHSNDLVVIKILQFNSSFFSWDELKLFEREAQTLQNLNHPAIPQYLDYFEVDNKEIRGFALVQTYITAPSLETTIKQGLKFSEVELIELVEKLLDILTYLHKQEPPVIHRDIKPSNILLTNRSGNSIGEIYLIDFGSAQTMAKREGSTITIVGTYGYIPLEQFGGKTVPASDLYSLGMTLIYILTGVHPAQLTQTNGKVEFNSQKISKKFKRWLEQMIHPHLDKRFNSAELAKTALTSNDNDSHLEKSNDSQPVNSHIKLYRDDHKFEIVYKDIHQINQIVIFYLSKNPFFYRILSIESNGSFKVGTYKEKDKIKWDYESSTKKITSLAYNPSYTFKLDYDPSYDPENPNEKYMRTEGRNIIIEPTLSLNEYAIYSNYQQLSEAELFWLGKELSDFLGLELKTIYRKPVLPRKRPRGPAGA